MPAHGTWSTGALFGLCGVLAVIVTLEMSAESLAPGVTAASRPAAEIPAFELAQYEAPPPDAFSVIAERPLFSESRRPYTAEATAEESASPTLSNPVHGAFSAELIGVLLTDRRRAALMLPEGAQEAIWLREGQTLDGWRIETIEHDRATLTRDGSDTVVDLRAD